MARQQLFSGFESYKLPHIQLTGKKLGQGAYATVVELKFMRRKCAGKIIHQFLLEQGDDSYTVRRFEEECRLLSRVRHPNIVQFLGVHFKEKEKVPMLVMEFLPMNLTSCIEKHGILPEERSYSILHDVALGLFYLHSQEPPILHRDLSANNVLLTENMKAKISDLGVARILNLTPLQVTRLTQTPGTPAYMPPEVMVAKPKYDASIDTFSFGILTMHILSGQWPEPQCGQIRMEGDLMIPVSEAKRRQGFLKVIGTDHKLMNLILKCIHNVPKERMCASDIVEKMSEMVSDQFSKQLNIDPVGVDKGGEEKISGELVSQKSQLDKDKGATMREEGSLLERTDGTDSKLTSKVCKKMLIIQRY